MNNQHLLKVKSKNRTSGWKELVSRKEDFLNIIKVLNRYYDAHPPKNYPTESHKFRENLLKSDVNSFRIFLKQFGEFEFMVSGQINSRSGKQFDSWIHVDGISHERKTMQEKGIMNHPVFEIVCLTDLFMGSSSEIKEKPPEIGFL
ncbi:MAG: hypothetical protein K8R21_04820 [Leptospira sp.]|nr:hypothetical protein [Leptospira sp.]